MTKATRNSYQFVLEKNLEYGFEILFVLFKENDKFERPSFDASKF